MDYITDHGDWTNVVQAGTVSAASPFVVALSPFYIKSFPLHDPWNTFYNAGTGVAGAGADEAMTNVADLGSDDFVVRSMGRNGQPSGVVYDPTDPEASRYNVGGMADFDQDLVAWSGNWIVAPATSLVGTAAAT
jgi:hypothetical protein